MPATSNRMATERKIQGIQFKATGVLVGTSRLTAHLALAALNSEIA
jgi:hypothetical protein